MAGWLHAWANRIVPPATSHADPAGAVLCGFPFGADEDGGKVPRQSPRNAGYLAEASPEMESCE